MTHPKEMDGPGIQAALMAIHESITGGYPFDGSFGVLAVDVPGIGEVPVLTLGTVDGSAMPVAILTPRDANVALFEAIDAGPVMVEDEASPITADEVLEFEDADADEFERALNGLQAAIDAAGLNRMVPEDEDEDEDEDL